MRLYESIRQQIDRGRRILESGTCVTHTNLNTRSSEIVSSENKLKMVFHLNQTSETTKPYHTINENFILIDQSEIC